MVVGEQRKQDEPVVCFDRRKLFTTTTTTATAMNDYSSTTTTTKRNKTDKLPLERCLMTGGRAAESVDVVRTDDGEKTRAPPLPLPL